MGRLPAFLFGWAELVIIRAAALGAVATAFAEYLLRALGHDPRMAPYDDWVHYVAAVAIAAVGWLNYRGVRWGTSFQNVLTLIKCGGLLALVILALTLGREHVGMHSTTSAVPATLLNTPHGSFGLASFGLALVSVLWVYDGWADVSFVAGEVKDPTRNLPRVLVLGTLLLSPYMCWPTSRTFLCYRWTNCAIPNWSRPTLQIVWSATAEWWLSASW